MAGSFSFQFDLPLDENDAEDIGHDNKRSFVEDGSENDVSYHISSSPRRSTPFQWVLNVRSLFQERRNEELVYNEIILQSEKNCVQPCTIRHVDLSLSSYRKTNEVESGMTPAADSTTDIQPGVYEGGRKVWECSWDLVKYLHSHPLERDVRCAWEMGCGHGLPGCCILRQYPQVRMSFSDFNEEVILDATLSNIVLNTQIDSEHASPVVDVCDRIQLGHGDWFGMTPTPPGFDLILAAETMYTEQAAKDTCELLLQHLEPTKGVAYIATKRYYFGVGGGVDAFRNASAGRLLVETVEVVDGGVGNIREILRVEKNCCKGSDEA